MTNISLLTSLLTSLTAALWLGPMAQALTRANSLTVSTPARPFEKVVVGGTVAPNGSAILSSTVAIIVSFNGARAACSGTLFTKRHILTAAHCLRMPNITSVVVKVTTKEDTSGLTMVADSWVRDPEFNHDIASADGTLNLRKLASADIAHDIAVITLARDVPSSVRPALLLENDDILKSEMPVKTAGYASIGDTLANYSVQDAPLHLDVADMTIHAVAPAAISLWNDGGGDPVQGDSGGPAYIVRGGHNYVWGVLSVGNHIEELYVRIAPHLAFIHDATGL